MITCENLLLSFFHCHGGFTHQQLKRIQEWWLLKRIKSEKLPEFLARENLISGATARILELFVEHKITEVMAHSLIDMNELTDLRSRLPDLIVDSEKDELAATVTLLAGNETVREAGGDPFGAQVAGYPRVGMRLGKYVLGEWLGEGSCGIVFRALHPTLQIPIAIKVLRPPGDWQWCQRLNAEAHLLARLNHQYIVRVFDFEPEAQFPFLVLEYVNGPTLAELIEQCGRIQPHRVIYIMRQLTEALAAAHKIGIVHRDIKPANVLLTRTGDCRLADLGLATAQLPLFGHQSQTAYIGNRAGTVYYVAPELAEGGVASEQSDLYSFGAMLYHALTGAPPFVGSTPVEVLSQHLHTPVLPPCSRVPEVSTELADVITWMLEKDPARRPSGFARLLREPILAKRPTNAPLSPVPMFER